MSEFSKTVATEDCWGLSKKWSGFSDTHITFVQFESLQLVKNAKCSAFMSFCPWYSSVAMAKEYNFT